MTTIPAGAPVYRTAPPNMFPGLRLLVDKVNGHLQSTKNTGAALIATVVKVTPVTVGPKGESLNGRTQYTIDTDLGTIGWQTASQRFGVAPFPGEETPPTRQQVHTARLAYYAGRGGAGPARLRARDQWHISSNHAGSGSFLCPPGHPAHRYGVIQGPTANPHTIMGVESAVGSRDVPEYIRVRLRLMLGEAVMVESEHWLRMVYGYFRNAYMPAGSVVVDTQEVAYGPGQDPELSAAVLTVRRYFPDHRPRLDLIEAAERGTAKLYGSHPCVHCGQRVQYEASVDGYAVFGRRHGDGATCADAPDGRHSWFSPLTVAEANLARAAAHAVRPWLLFPGLRIYVNGNGNSGLAATPKEDVTRGIIATVISTELVNHTEDGKPVKRPLYMIYTDLGLVGYQAPSRLFALAPLPGSDRPATDAEFVAAHDAYRARKGA